MALYTYRCPNCPTITTVQAPIHQGPTAPTCDCGTTMRRDYKADKPQPAPMWPEHYNPSTGTVVRTRRQMQDDLNRGAEEQYERTGIPSSPVVVDRADLPSFRKDT